MSAYAAEGFVAAPAAAVVAAAKPVWTLDQVVSNFERWGIAWTAGTPVPYAFLNNVPAALASDPAYDGFRSLTAEEKSFVRMALQLISDVANISFVETPDNGSVNGRLTYAASTTMPDYVWGWADPHNVGARLSRADIWLNANAVAERSWFAGGYNFMATIHETLHGIGLPHPGEYNADGGSITYGMDAEYFQDSRQYTVMSYFSAAETGADFVSGGGSYSAATPLLHDVAALQAIYGANLTTRASDTVYGYNSTADRDVLDFTKNTTPIVCIWDAGGIDTLDLSGSSSAVKLDLREGAFSDACDFTSNITIAYGAVIENARGSAWSDTLYGNAVGNQLRGEAGTDTLWGYDGADLLDGGAGSDLLHGGVGDDTYLIDDFADLVFEAAGEGTDTVRASITYALGAEVERLILTGGAVNGTGNALANFISGTAGANLLSGGDGADTLIGGGGGDQLYGGTGIDTVSYADATAGVAINLVAGTVTGFSVDILNSIENLVGSAFADALKGNSGANALSGGGGDDVIEGGGGNDRLDGGDGVDTASYANTTGGVGVTVALGVSVQQDTGAAGLDTLLGFENLTGSRYADRLTGTAGANALTGGYGDDVLEGGVGDDRLDGGFNTDTASYAGAAAGVSVNLNALGEAQDTGGAGIDTLLSIENVTGSAFADSLRGNVGNNLLTGGDGDDLLEGGGGHDQLVGGAGNDTASYAGAAAAVTVKLTTSAAQATGGAGSDTLNGIENLVGSRYADRLVGDAGNNLLDGGSGDDLLEGGAGNDILIGGAGSDTATYAGASSGVTVNLNTAAAQNTGGAGVDTLSGVENLTGSSFSDSFRGGSGNNALAGGAGDDVLEGGGGDDLLDGGVGNDTASYANAAAAVSVNLNAGAVQATVGAGTDTYASIENVTGSKFDDSLRGNAGANVLDGGLGNDSLNGGGGADVLIGGGGDDVLLGAAGDDLFRFGSGFGHDRIDDFTAGGTEDRLDFSGFAGSGVSWSLAQVGEDAVFSFSDGSVLTLAHVAMSSLVQTGDWTWA